MSVQYGRKCQKALQFDRFVEAVGRLEDTGLQQEFDMTFKQLMSVRQKPSQHNQPNAVRVLARGPGHPARGD